MNIKELLITFAEVSPLFSLKTESYAERLAKYEIVNEIIYSIVFQRACGRWKTQN